MTETERWVNEVCDLIVQSGRVHLYRDLYKDLRERLPCGEACRLIAGGLERTRREVVLAPVSSGNRLRVDRARAMAAIKRLSRYVEDREVDEKWGWLYGK